jgi:hypothetical protein
MGLGTPSSHPLETGLMPPIVTRYFMFPDMASINSTICRSVYRHSMIWLDRRMFDGCGVAFFHHPGIVVWRIPATSYTLYSSDTESGMRDHTTVIVTFQQSGSTKAPWDTEVYNSAESLQAL